MPHVAKNTPYQFLELPNGLLIVLRPMPQAESAAVGMWVRAGGRYERVALGGISHFIEHLLFKGTATRSCEALKQAVEGVGGSLNAFTAEEFTCYMAKVPAGYLRRTIAVLSDMLRHSALRARDIEREREVILEEIRMAEDAPGQHIHEIFNQLLWPNHPLGQLLAGTEETVKRIRRRDLVAYWRRHYQSNDLLVSCAGAMDADRVVGQLRRTFGRVRRGSIPRMTAAPRPLRGPQVRVVHKATEQTHVCLGTPAMPRTHRHRFALELLHVLLGANMSSRLFREVREKRGLVYEIGTHVKRYHDTGAFVVYAGCDVGKLDTTLRTVLAELARIRRELVRPTELRRAKEFYRGQLAMGLEDTMEHMLWMGEQAVTVGRISRPQDVLAGINRVTAPQIRQVARMLFRPERLYLAAIGPVPASQADALRQLCGRA